MADPYRQAPELEDDGFPVRIEVTLDEKEFALAIVDFAKRDFPDVDWEGAEINVDIDASVPDKPPRIAKISITKEIQKGRIKI